MTRFQIVGIFNDKVLTAGEFNGDGYFENGHGEELCAKFPEVKTEEDYRKLVKEINDNYFNYNEDLIYEYENRCIKYGDDYCDIFDFYELYKKQGMFGTHLYYNIWFSDYLYIINLKDCVEEIVDEEGREIKIKPNGWVTINFGSLYEQDNPDAEIKCMSNIEISELNHFKILIQEEGWDVRDNEDGTWDICIYSRMGEDFYITIDTKDDIARQVLSEADNFDPNEHVTEWIRSGVEGIPNVRDLIDDADWISDALCDLAEKLNCRK